MVFVVEDKTPETLGLCPGQALRPCSGQAKVGRYAFEGDEERVGQQFLGQMGSFELLTYLGVRSPGPLTYYYNSGFLP